MSKKIAGVEFDVQVNNKEIIPDGFAESLENERAVFADLVEGAVEKLKAMKKEDYGFMLLADPLEHDGVSQLQVAVHALSQKKVLQLLVGLIQVVFGMEDQPPLKAMWDKVVMDAVLEAIARSVKE